MNRHRQIVITLLLFAAVLLLFEATSLDMWVQQHFYDAAAWDKEPLDRWLISKHDHAMETLFHRIPKRTVVSLGVVSFLLGIAGFWMKRLRPWRERLLFLACAMTLVPVLVGAGKQFSHTYCPNQTLPFGGDLPYVKVTEPYPADFTARKNGRCWPAGHATTGFCLMALYFAFRRRAARIAGLTAGLVLGWVLGIFQMLRGEHFLSHTVISMLGSWLVILVMQAAFRRFYPARWRTEEIA